MAWLRKIGTVVAVVGLAAACGSKSGLLDARGSADAGSGGVGASGGIGGSSSGGSSGSSGAGGSVDAGVDAPPPPPCRLQIVGEPIQVVAFAEGSAGDVDLALLDPGSANRPARIGYLANSEEANFWHPELRVAEIEVGQSWPDGVTVPHAPVLWGFDAHAGGVMSVATTGPGLALAFYHADEANPNVTPALKFRSFDEQSWQPGPELTIDLTGDGSYELAPGDKGYAVAYRASLEAGGSEPRAAILDAKGNVSLGPIALAPAGDYPGVGASVAWSGSEYLAAVNFGDCKPTPNPNTPCDERVIGIERIASGTIALTASIPYLSPSHVARRPSMASFGSETWVAWREAPEEAPQGPWHVRVAKLAPGGSVASIPLELGAAAMPVNGVAIHVSSVGVVVSWAEVGPDTVPPNVLGHSKLIVHHLDFDGTPLQDVLELPVTELAYDPPHGIVTLDHPRSVIFGWAGKATGVEMPNRGLLARLDCIE